MCALGKAVVRREWLQNICQQYFNKVFFADWKPTAELFDKIADKFVYLRHIFVGIFTTHLFLIVLLC